MKYWSESAFGTPDFSPYPDELIALRRDLHAEPEIGLALPRTQEKVLAALEGLPLRITTGRALSSVVAVLEGGPGPVVLLRADMDALPVTETAEIPFASRFHGIMHACGHDLHTAMLVGAARLLSARDLPGTVVFMFQPGEEQDHGARLMLAEGVLDAAGRRPVAAYALHVFGSLLPAGRVTTRGGPMLAASDSLSVTVRGRGGHGSMPHHALDPVPAACEMVTALQTFVTRSFDVFDPVVVTVGRFNAGTAVNVIPAEARFEATIRSFSPRARARATAGVVHLLENIAAAHHLTVDARIAPGYPVTENDPAEAALLGETVERTLGDGRFETLARPYPGSEDFSYVLGDVPGALAAIGGCPPGRDPLTAPANHSADVAYDEDVIADGAALYTALALRRMSARSPAASAARPG
ncbi:M20 family metallopeptidase [Actinocorallia longicatena]|uniref:M20 family metallopeptidase n=1 Tax=Actinocorallia longicatena TaxID=111803 RepID=A0ABP6PXU7_9ACTN